MGTIWKKKKQNEAEREKKRKDERKDLTLTGLLMEENRQEELPTRRTAQTGEGSRNADRADVCADAGRSASLPEESRGRLFSGVAPRTQGLRGEPAGDEHQERRRPLFEDHAGAGGALHPGTLWRRQ